MFSLSLGEITALVVGTAVTNGAQDNRNRFQQTTMFQW
jgi:hypothetical protein